MLCYYDTLADTQESLRGEVLGYMPAAASRSGGKAVRFCCTVASLFCLTGRGTVGKVGLGVGRRYQEGEDKKAGRKLNTTQHNRQQKQMYMHVEDTRTKPELKTICPLGI